MEEEGEAKIIISLPKDTPTMSTAFSDFGPLTERRRADKQRQQRKRLMIAGIVTSVVLILIIAGAAAFAVVYNSKKKCASSSPSGGSGGLTKSIKAMCAATDYRDVCEKSLTWAAKNASTSSPKDIIRASVAVIGEAIGRAVDSTSKITSKDPRVKAAVADCRETYENARDDLARTLRGIDASGGTDELTRRGHELRLWLSAVMAHQETCIDGFPDDGELKAKMRKALAPGKELTSNALAIIENGSSVLAATANKGKDKDSQRRLLGDDDAPRRRLLKSKFENKLTPDVVVAKDGSGKFRSINEALDAMPKTYDGRYVIYVKEGVYEEYVTVGKKMVNVTMYSDDAKKTIITGSKNFVDGLTTYKTATFSVFGDGFTAIALGFRNTAGAAKHQAVALLVQSDRSIFLNCRMEGYQGTLYAHSKAQFYRNCVVAGTVDFIFGDAAAVFQNCILAFRRPLDGQQDTATAHGRADRHENTGFVLQHCRFTAESKLRGAPAVRSYLARPWREYSRTLVMDSEIPGFVDRAGYLPWSGDFALNTLWYAEYGNTGAGADTSGRVGWPAYHKAITKEDAARFTVGTFLHAEPWIKDTGTPVQYGMWA